ncbi:MAG: caspase family protein [Deltaproteobacteria bacterium]|nr:caspase family protein [Deltaproteobacteria bacterium]
MRHIKACHWLLPLFLLVAGCFPVTSAPHIVRVSDLLSQRQEQQTKETVFPVVMERFMDQRTNRNILGQYDIGGRGGFLGTVTIASDADISSAFETIVKTSLERKGIPAGQSVFILRGAIQRAIVGAAPDSRTLNADVAMELMLVDSGSGARLWQKSYQGVAVGSEPQTTLALAFGDLETAIDRDDSLLGLRKNFLALGGKLPENAASVSASPVQPKGVSRGPVSDVDRPGQRRGQPRPHDFALLIGIENYQNAPDTPYAERDAATVKLYMEGLGIPEENVIFLTGARATRTGIAKYLEEWLPRNVAADSRIYFYYAGHGAPEPDTGTAYILPWDGDPTFLSTTAYPLHRLYEKLQALPAKEVIVMLDSCFSGAGGRSVIAKGARPLVLSAAQTAPIGAKLSVLAASSANQITGSLEQQGHGMFTYYLLKGLQGEADANDDNHMSLSELITYVEKNVQKAARRQNREQTPQLQTARPDLTLY